MYLCITMCSKRNTIYIFITLFIISVFQVAGLSAASKADDFTIVIDAGHGGKDVGAVDNGAKEKDINLAVAKNLASLLKKKKGINVVMTRDDDTFVTLQERADIANRSKGKLFISIHTNSVDKKNPNRSSVAGASVYALGLHKDASNLQVAMRENAVIELESDFEERYSGFDPNKDESYIIFEMAQKKNLEQSLKFANMAQKGLVAKAGRANRGVKQAGFWVLWATSMPAVLVELDFICNPQSAEYMQSDKGRKQLAEALAEAVDDYVKSYRARMARGKDVLDENTDEQLASDTPMLAPNTHVERKDTPPALADNKGNNARRRRSLSSKANSDKRDVEADQIIVKDENVYLAVEPAPPVALPEPTPVINEKQNKSKSNKKTKQKAVKEAPKPVLAQNDTDAKKTAHRSKVERVNVVYKIQLFACADELKANDPRFGGLKPVRAFRENNMYVYTYGESKERGEIDNMLKEVKKIVPDAFVIQSKK